jgi:porin
MQRKPSCPAAANVRTHVRALLLFSAAAMSWAPVEASAEEPVSDALLGTWGGIRPALLNEGVRLDASYTGERAANLAGGTGTGSVYLDLSELRLTLDGNRLLGWNGTTGFVHALRAHGGNPSALAGDAQGVSNIAAGNVTRLYEAWVQQNFAHEQLSLLAGRYDLTSEFYVLQSAGLFLNSSFGIGPEFSTTGQGGPSIYPDTAVGARIGARPLPSLVVRMAVLNGVPVNVPRADGSTGIRRNGDGWLLVGEAAVYSSRVDAADADADGQPHSRRQRLGRAAINFGRDGKLAFGVWHFTGSFDRLDTTSAGGATMQEHGSSGFYAIGEKVVHRDPQNSAREVKVFLQLGVGDQDAFRFARYVGSGVTFAGYIPNRAADEFGIAFASARNGSPYIDSERRQGRNAEPAETAIELTYLAPVRSWLSLQPSLQYVVNPGTDPARGNATVALLRFEITL